MKPVPVNDRKANERKRKREAGLVPVEAWIHVSQKEKLKKAIARLNKEAEKV
jgi:hypothetical protein